MDFRAGSIEDGEKSSKPGRSYHRGPDVPGGTARMPFYRQKWGHRRTGEGQRSSCVCPLSQSKMSMLKSLSSKWGYQQVGASPSLITGVEPFSTLLLPLYRGSLLIVRTQLTEVYSLQLGRGASWEPSHTGIPISDCPAFRTETLFSRYKSSTLQSHVTATQKA